MFNLKVTKTEPSDLDKAITRLYELMAETGPETQAYDAMTNQLTKLHKLKETETSSKRVSPDTLAIIAGNLAGIVALLSYERAHVITSKALGFVLKSAVR